MVANIGYWTLQITIQAVQHLILNRAIGLKCGFISKLSLNIHDLPKRQFTSMAFTGNPYSGSQGYLNAIW
jgi:hypothetical protein